MVLLVIRCTNEIYFNPIPHVSYPPKGFICNAFYSLHKFKILLRGIPHVENSSLTSAHHNIKSLTLTMETISKVKTTRWLVPWPKTVIVSSILCQIKIKSCFDLLHLNSKS